MALEAGRDVVRAARCLEVMAHVGFSALNAYGPDGGVFNAGGCRGRRRLGRSAAADALPVVKTAASFQESPGKATILPSPRSEEHTSELQSLMRISYAVFCLKKKTQTHTTRQSTTC